MTKHKCIEPTRKLRDPTQRTKNNYNNKYKYKYKIKQINGITKQIKNQASTARPTQDFKRVQCELKPMSKIMLEKE